MKPRCPRDSSQRCLPASLTFRALWADSRSPQEARPLGMAGPGPLGGPENHLWFKRSLGMSAFVWITKSWRANPHGEGKGVGGQPSPRRGFPCRHHGLQERRPQWACHFPAPTLYLQVSSASWGSVRVFLCDRQFRSGLRAWPARGAPAAGATQPEQPERGKGTSRASREWPVV